MVQVDQSALNEAGEWVPWQTARTILTLAGVCDVTDEPELLSEWAEQGELVTRARLLFVDGKLQKNGIIGLSTWRAAREHGKRDLWAGHLECEDSSLFDGKTFRIRARDIEVNYDCFRELLPLDEDDVERMNDAIREQAEPSNINVQSTKGARVSVVGKKPQLDRWQRFYFAAIELAKEGRLTAACFPSAAALREELLFMMGDGAFSADHAKPYVAQLFKRFVEGN